MGSELKGTQVLRVPGTKRRKIGIVFDIPLYYFDSPIRLTLVQKILDVYEKENNSGYRHHYYAFATSCNRFITPFQAAMVKPNAVADYAKRVLSCGSNTVTRSLYCIFRPGEKTASLFKKKALRNNGGLLIY